MADGADWRIEWYRTKRGEAPAQTFLAALDGPLAAEAAALLAYVRGRGQGLQEPRSKSLGDGLFELRGRHGVRLFYTFRPRPPDRGARRDGEKAAGHPGRRAGPGAGVSASGLAT